MQINKTKICRTYEQQLSEQFLFSVKNGASPVLVVPNNFEAYRAFEFIKMRSSHVYIGNEDFIFGFHIMIANEVTHLQGYSSIGILEAPKCNLPQRLMESLKMSSLPMLLSYVDSTIQSEYWSDTGPKFQPTYPIKACLIENEEIKNLFKDTFLIATKEINIISPWINKSVVNEQLIALFEYALNRDVSIKIIYGIGNSNDPRSQASDDVVTFLKNKFSKYSDKLFFKKDNTHVKLLICDNKYIMMGSYNFLSFTGDYSTDDVRHEAVDYILDSKMIDERRIHFFNW